MSAQAQTLDWAEQTQLPLGMSEEDPDYLTQQLVTYIGNKRALLGTIRSAVDDVVRRTARNELRILGSAGRGLLARLALPDPWAGTVNASLQLIEDLDGHVRCCERELRTLGADHEYVPLLMSAPGIAWVLGYTIDAPPKRAPI